MRLRGVPGSRHRRIPYLAGVCLCTLLLLSALPTPAEDGRAADRPRVIVIKVDGLSPWLVEAAVNPEDDLAISQLDDPVQFRRAVTHFRQQLGRQQLLPNLERYFFRNGVRAQHMYSATVTLSAVAWSVLDTGQPSVVKGHGVFERDTGYSRSYLDFLRDTVDFIKRRGDKTLGVWVLDQAGVSLTSDAFDPDRVWMAPQMYLRPDLREYLSRMGMEFVSRGHKFSEPQTILKGHLAARVGDPQYVEFGEAFMMEQLSRKILERDYTGSEPYDLLTGFFSQIDHQQHSEPSPEGLLARLIHFDELVGEVFHAVEHSQRRANTYVVIISDHGQEFVPGLTAASVPLTRLFRSRMLGGHTTQTLLSEETDRALTVPLSGVDYPRLYESDFSPYGKAAPGGVGEKGWPTTYVEPFGNARAELHLRNNDLNRLHLVLLALRRADYTEEQGQRLGERLQESLLAIDRWLPADLSALRDYYLGASDWTGFLDQSPDPYQSDTAARLRVELKRLEPQLEILTRLQALVERAKAKPVLAELRSQRPRVVDYIPQRYYGPRNSFYQLSHYTVGLDDNQQWVETTVDWQGRPVPMDYFQVLSDFEVANPPTPDNRNPFDLIVHAIAPETIQAALVDKKLVSSDELLQDVVWVRSTVKDDPRKGGEGLIMRRGDGLVKYVPVERLSQDAVGHFSFVSAMERDPLALLSDPTFLAVAGEDPSSWLAQWHTAKDWLDAIHETRYTTALLVFLDLAGQNYRAFIERPEFQRDLVGFSSEAMKQRYLRGLERKYSNFRGDFWVWSSNHFNFSSKGPEPAGSHGGLGWRVARTSFFLWGGEQTGVRRAAMLEEPATTLDVAPTILCLAGRLSSGHRAIAPSAAAPPRPRPSYPGHALDVLSDASGCTSPDPGQVAAQR